MKKRNGFTLIEIAVVLMVIGVIVMMGSKLVSTSQRSMALMEGKLATESANAFVSSYIARTGGLPSQADFTAYITANQTNKFIKDNAIEVMRYVVNEQFGTRQDLMRVCYPDTVINNAIIPVGDQGAIVYAAYVELMMNGTAQYSSIISYDEARKLAGCNTPALDNTARILTETLPPVVVGRPYNAKILTKGGNISVGVTAEDATAFVQQPQVWGCIRVEDNTIPLAIFGGQANIDNAANSCKQNTQYIKLPNNADGFSLLIPDTSNAGLNGRDNITITFFMAYLVPTGNVAGVWQNNNNANALNDALRRTYRIPIIRN